jgi:hypothetical protein
MSVVFFALELAGDVSSFTPSVRAEMKSTIHTRVAVVVAVAATVVALASR